MSIVANYVLRTWTNNSKISSQKSVDKLSSFRDFLFVNAYCWYSFMKRLSRFRVKTLPWNTIEKSHQNIFPQSQNTPKGSSLECVSSRRPRGTRRTHGELWVERGEKRRLCWAFFDLLSCSFICSLFYSYFVCLLFQNDIFLSLILIFIQFLSLNCHLFFSHFYNINVSKFFTFSFLNQNNNNKLDSFLSFFIKGVSLILCVDIWIGIENILRLHQMPPALIDWKRRQKHTRINKLYLKEIKIVILFCLIFSVFKLWTLMWT